MAWELVRREDRYQRDGRPFISISRHRISFSAAFTRHAELGTGHRVSIHADASSLRLGFEFHMEETPHSLTLVPDNSAQSKQPGLFCSSHNLVNRCSWVLGVTRLPAKDRRFYPKKEGKLWTITLCPSFESRFARESQNIPKDAKGIYRYIRENGEIVYIGRGNICGRLARPERETWDFDVVEYSVVEDPDQQIHWESYWLDKFKQAHGRLPFYNKVSGAGSSQEQAE
jgi:hypothetical protein